MTATDEQHLNGAVKHGTQPLPPEALIQEPRNELTDASQASAPVEGRVLPKSAPQGQQEPWERDDQTHLDRPLLRATKTQSSLLGRWGSDDPILPSREERREAARRRKRQMKRAALRLLANSHRLAWRGVWWPTRGVGIVGWRFLRWVTAMELHPLHGANPAITQDQQRTMTKQWIDERNKRVAVVIALVVLALGLTGVIAVVSALLGLWAWFEFLFIAGIAVSPVAGYVGLLRAGRPKRVKPLSVRTQEHVAPDLTVGMIAATLAQVVGGQTGKAILEAPYDVIQEGAVKGSAQVFRCVLPGAADAEGLVSEEQRIASGLGRPVDCAIVKLLPQVSAGHFDLHVFDRSVFVGSIPASPIVAAKRTNYWALVPVGLTRAQDLHRERLWGGAWFVGGKPEHGKSEIGKIAVAWAILDPTAKVLIFNFKGDAGYEFAERCCHEYVSVSPERDKTAIGKAHKAVRWLLEECGRRNDFLTKLKKAGKTKKTEVDEELARLYPDELGPILCLIDEIHRAFAESDYPQAAQFGEDYGKAMKAVRSVGMTMFGLTQLAGGESIPKVVTAASRVRICLRVDDTDSFKQIYGQAGPGVVKALGITEFPTGVAVMSSLEGRPTKIRVHHITPHLDAVGERAYRLRSTAGTLTGHAAGENVELSPADGMPDPADLLRTLLPLIPACLPAGGTGDDVVAWLSELEEALTDLDMYASHTASGWLAKELRLRGVEPTDLNRRRGYAGRAGGRKELAVTEQAIRQRLVEIASGDGPGPVYESTAPEPRPEIDPELVDEAIDLVVTTQFVSTSMLQRKLRAGHAEVLAVLAALEEAEVVSKPGVDGSRRVLRAPDSATDHE